MKRLFFKGCYLLLCMMVMGSLVACGDDDEGGSDGQDSGNDTALIGLWEQVHIESSDEDGVVDEDTRGKYVVFYPETKGCWYSIETGKRVLRWLTKDNNVLVVSDKYETTTSTYTLSEDNNKLVVHTKYVENGVPCYTISTWERRDHIDDGGSGEVIPPKPGEEEDNGMISGVWACARKVGYDLTNRWDYDVAFGNMFLVFEEDGTGYVSEKRYGYEKETFTYRLSGNQLLIWNEGESEVEAGTYKLIDDGRLLQVTYTDGDEYDIMFFIRSSKDQLPEGLRSVRRTRSFLIA